MIKAAVMVTSLARDTQFNISAENGGMFGSSSQTSKRVGRKVRRQARRFMLSPVQAQYIYVEGSPIEHVFMNSGLFFKEIFIFAKKVEFKLNYQIYVIWVRPSVSIKT